VVLACIALALALGAAARSAAPTSPSFGLTYDIDTGRGCYAFALGDLNRDKRPDLVYGCYDDGESVAGSIFFNRGNGDFAYSGDYLEFDETHAYLVTSLALGDLNGDGTADLVVGYDGLTGSLSVLLNRGNGTFLPQVDYRTGGPADSVAVGDVDGDGDADVVIARNNAVTVLINRGDGSLLQPVRYAVGRGGYWGGRTLALEDVTGDGAVDAVTPNDKDGTVSVLVNRGDGTFTRRNYATEPHPNSVAIGDLNADGQADVVTAGSRRADADFAASVLFNRGNGRLGPRRDYRGIANSVAIGDLNGDELPDLAGTGVLGVSVLFNDGHGRFGSKLDYHPGTGDENAELKLADFDADGRLDLASANDTQLHNDQPTDLAVALNTPGLCNVQFVRGSKPAAARRKLARVNCRVGRLRRIHSRMRAGLVLGTKPRFGGEYRGGKRVDLIVSRGPKR
jgi:hypothetical protein